MERLAGYIVLDMHMDRYFLRVKPRMRAPISGLDYEDHNHPSSFDLDALVRDLDAHRQAAEADVIIVEGLLTLYHQPLRERLDLAIFLDAPPTSASCAACAAIWPAGSISTALPSSTWIPSASATKSSSSRRGGTRTWCSTVPIPPTAA